MNEQPNIPGEIRESSFTLHPHAVEPAKMYEITGGIWMCFGRLFRPNVMDDAQANEDILPGQSYAYLWEQSTSKCLCYSFAATYEEGMLSMGTVSEFFFTHLAHSRKEEVEHELLLSKERARIMRGPLSGWKIPTSGPVMSGDVAAEVGPFKIRIENECGYTVPSWFLSGMTSLFTSVEMSRVAHTAIMEYKKLYQFYHRTRLLNRLIHYPESNQLYQEERAVLHAFRKELLNGVFRPSYAVHHVIPALRDMEKIQSMTDWLILCMDTSQQDPEMDFIEEDFFMQDESTLFDKTDLPEDTLAFPEKEFPSGPAQTFSLMDFRELEIFISKQLVITRLLCWSVLAQGVHETQSNEAFEISEVEINLLTSAINQIDYGMDRYNETLRTCTWDVDKAELYNPLNLLSDAVDPYELEKMLKKHTGGAL